MCGCQQDCIPTDSDVWELQHPDAPRQRDAGGSTGVNCGVHVCATGERLINRLPVDFTGTEIDDKYRHIIGKRLLTALKKRLLTALKARRALTTRDRPAAVDEHADISVGDHTAGADSEHAAAAVGPHTAAANGDRAAVAVVDHTAAANGERAAAAMDEYTIEGSNGGGGGGVGGWGEGCVCGSLDWV